MDGVLAAPRLYRVADFDVDDAQKAYQFLKVVSSCHNLGSFVCRLSVISVLDGAVLIFVPALRNMPNLQHFCCKRLGGISLYDSSVLDVIANLPALRSFDTVSTHKYDWNGLLDRLPPLQSLTVDAADDEVDALERLLLRSRDRLQFLDAEYWEMEYFLQNRGRGIVWPRMTELRVSGLRSPAPAAAFPNLEALHVSSMPISPEAMHILGDPSVLPRLRQLSIVASPRPETVDRGAGRRRLTHLHVDVRSDAMPDPAMQGFMAAFSWQHLQSLQLVTGDCAMLDSVLELLPSLLAGCSQLSFFAVSHHYWRRFPDANPLYRVLDTLNGMPESVELPKLRYIVLYVSWNLKEATEVGSVMEAIEGKLDLVFERALGLHILQCKLTGKVMSWAHPFFLGGERQVDKLPTRLTDVVQFLEGEIEW